MTRRSMFGGESSAESWGIKRREPENADIDVTPMVDCVFLLLSFFMVSSPLRGNPDRNIPAAANGVGVNPLGVITLRINGPADSPRISLDRREARLDEVRPYVEAEVQKGHRLVVIKADGNIPVGIVQKVAQEATSVEGVKYSFGVRDKRGG